MVSRFSSHLLAYSCAFLDKCAGIEEDMGNRIMYSVLPHLADPAQVALTGGVVDYNALKIAVEGRKNLIKYGVEAVLNELHHADDSGFERTAKAFYVGGNIEDAVATALACFEDGNLWLEGFGGEAWAKIAKTLLQIVRLDKTLSKIRSSPNKDHNQEVQVMQDLIVEMNIFDGLAHNSDDVMRNLIELESAEKMNVDPTDIHGSLSNEEYQKFHKFYDENHKRVKRLMDAKELESPAEVFRRISPTLEGSGDINKFKSWVSKMRQTEEFKKSDPDVARKLFFIFLRKHIIPWRKELNRYRDRLRKPLEDAKKYSAYTELQSELDLTIDLIQIDANSFTEIVSNFLKQYPEFFDFRSDFLQITDAYKKKARQIFDELKAMFLKSIDAARNLHASITDSIETRGDNKVKLDKMIDDVMTKINQFSYMLDMI